MAYTAISTGKETMPDAADGAFYAGTPVSCSFSIPTLVETRTINWKRVDGLGGHANNKSLETKNMMHSSRRVSTSLDCCLCPNGMYRQNAHLRLTPNHSCSRGQARKPSCQRHYRTQTERASATQ
jgi:hypothetical protein